MPDPRLQEIIEMTKIKGQIETIERHHNKYTKDFDTLFAFMQDFKVSLIRIENSIEKTSDLPEKVRKLEDKSVVIDLLKIAIGIAIGALISGYVGQNLIPSRETDRHKTEVGL